MTDSDMKERIARLDLQNAEFDSLRDLAKEFEALCRVPVVDDYYPEARHYYETKLQTFMAALKANGRTL